jgi:hypothetical protein
MLEVSWRDAAVVAANEGNRLKIEGHVSDK